MANDTTGRTWVCDTVGMLTDKPVKVRKIVFYPNAASDSATLKYWEILGGTGKSEVRNGTATVATNTLTSTGNFVTANVAAGDCLRINNSSTTNNLGNYYVVSRDSDNQVTLSFKTMTDEVDAVYTWFVYKAVTAAVLKADTIALIQVQLDFGPGIRFPSLGCTSITSSSDKVYIHLA